MSHCSIDGCDNPAYCSGWCRMHYSRWQAHGDPLKKLPMGPAKGWRGPKPPCGEEGCDLISTTAGYCTHHYKHRRYEANKAFRIAQSTEYRHAHPDMAKEIDRRSYRKHHERYLEKNRKRRETHPGENDEYARRRQSESLETATRYYHEWAGWEFELIADTSRTSTELATTLGRTVGAVMTMRHNLRYDPKTIERAGLGDVV